MNLVPIDTGGTPTELVGGDASPGGDFAALMNGLMAGDTQIVPLFDVTTGEQLPEGAEASEGDDVEDAMTVLGFVGTPPSGLTIPAALADVAASGSSATTDEPTELAGQVTAILPEGGAPVTPGHDDQYGSADAQLLATVHPISREVQAGSETPAADGNEAGPATRLRAVEPVPVAATSSPDTTRSDTTAPQATVDPLRQTPIATTDAAAARPTRSAGELAPNDASTRDGTEVEAEVELDAAATTRPLANLRNSAVTQPVMVGVARRVEEAIAALATKPDPKIVTLQLDELDGLRLTVALRPDGIHLSSSGDAALTTDIERALATRGFDMASGSDRGRQGPEQDTDDGWRPQPATPGRQPRTNPSGIRL